MPDPEHPNVARVRDFAASRGVQLAVSRFPAGTRTAVEAARAIGVTPGQIVKSLVFRVSREVDETVVVLCSGAARVDERKVASALGAATVRRATADEAKVATGYAIGGVPPFAHAAACRVLCDRTLLAFDVVWAASGLPDAVFPITPADLVRLSAAEVVDVAAEDRATLDA
ncbi:MAG: YbaK/EbsC family protein [Chloroflexota bacterium]|nr:YbaK/EbsC family protein [Chloroflexota bacterium]